MQTYLVTEHLQVADLEVVVCEFYEGHLRIYACFRGYSCAYFGNQWARLKMRKVCYGSDRDHLEEVQRENMIASLNVVDKCLWSKPYIVYDSC